MDISLLVMENLHPDANYRRGDVVDVSKYHTEECSHPRFVLVCVMNIPENFPKPVAMRRLKQMLEAQIKTGAKHRSIRRRAYRFNFSLMPTPKRQLLLEDRRMEMEWSEAKSYLARRFIINNDDDSQDGHTFLTDEDV